MSEQVSNRYRPLFEIRLLHHYWLDEGGIVFDQLKSKEDTKDKNEEKRNERLRSYDCRRFFVIEPTAGTAKILNGFGCIYKTTALGCIVAVPDKVNVPAQTMFEFVVTVRDADFFYYTALTLRPQKIYEFYDKQEKRTYRYKENLSVLSNRDGVMRNIDSNGNTLFLSQEFPDTADGVESFFIENDQLKQMISDKSGDVQKLGAKDGSPVYVHQGDIPPDITPPPNLSEEEKEKWENVPKRGWLLSDGIPDDVFILIRLQARPNRLDNKNEEFSLVDENGQAKEKDDEEGKRKPDNPVFDVRFKNRSTFWQYHDKKTGEIIPNGSENKPIPLAYFGNAGTKQKPSNGDPVKIEKDEHSKVTKLVSEIFI
ncbi:MAG: hypothetical protein D3916_04155 [Candidatus Electrothrix sp. MAN1_4]|nr:hypothetical protein [Candidatus Electrothrix sp. MAN1_4]